MKFFFCCNAAKKKIYHPGLNSQAKPRNHRIKYKVQELRILSEILLIDSILSCFEFVVPSQAFEYFYLSENLLLALKRAQKNFAQIIYTLSAADRSPRLNDELRSPLARTSLEPRMTH